jgi:hypothetical protein
MRVREEPILLQLHNPYSHEALFQLVVHWGSLPRAARLYVALGKPAPPGPLGTMKGRDLARAGLKSGGRKGRALFAGAHVNPRRVYSLAPGKERLTRLPEVLIGPDRPAVVAIHLVVPRKRDGPEPRFDVVQLAGARVLGGCTFVVGRE